MMCAATAGILGKGSEIKTLYCLGASRGFVRTNLGLMLRDITYTCWYRFSGQNPTTTSAYDKSKTVIKYGNSSTGIGYGTNCTDRGSTILNKAMLVEAIVWTPYEQNQSFDTGWHHLAIKIKTESYPAEGAVYLDGRVLQPIRASQSNVKSPQGEFHICGRSGNDETPLTGAHACRCCLYDKLLSDAEIAADMNRGRLPPNLAGLAHYWDGSVENGLVVDRIGSWDLTFSNGCSILTETPWDASASY